MKRQTFFRTSLIGLLFFLNFNLFAKLNNYPVPDRDTVPAFPGAEGAGKFTSGGAGGQVYIVNKLDDDGSEGTLRWALEQEGRRTVVFAVDGTISLDSHLLVTNGDLTIAGQTAPGQGICLKNYPLLISADNVIVRYIRSRMGDERRTQDDAMGAMRQKNIIVDHCSMSWGTDECASFYNNQNFTLQWCIISESLANSIHQKGEHGYGGIWGGQPASFHHNLIAHHTSRTPRFNGSRQTRRPQDEKVDFRNNVIYNWGPIDGGYAGEGGFYNLVNNYYKPAYATVQNTKLVNRIFAPWVGRVTPEYPRGETGRFYVSGNYFDDGSPALDQKHKSLLAAVNRDNWLGIHPNEDFKGELNELRLDKPVEIAEINTQNAREAYLAVLAGAGASLHRDKIDRRIVEETRTGTCINYLSGGTGIVDSQSQLGGWPELKTAPAPADSDADGMPDEWEKLKGLDPNNPADASLYQLSPSYTNLEVYMNSLVCRPWEDRDLPVDERIESLVKEMSLEEKCGQLVNGAPGIERLGILPYDWWNEALHGVGRNGRATVFPQAIGLAATFDEDLIFRVASAISDEARAKFNASLAMERYEQYSGLTFWTPNINIFRDPRWGRGQETYGEDPYLTSRLGTAFVRGLQGDNPDYLKTAACVKHYAVHSGPEALRHEFDAHPSARDFYETYLPAFETLVKEAKVEAVMGAYNRVYGLPACGSGLLLDTILRQQWGFEGHIVSDCGAIRDFYTTHKVVQTPEQAAAMAANVGLNVNCGSVYRYLGAAIEQGLVTETTIDNLIRPLLRTKIKLGFFDPSWANPYNSIGPEVVESPAHLALTREAAGKSMVLLKNDKGVLPLDKNIRSLYITGPFAADANVLLGNYYGLSSSLSTFLEGIVAKLNPGSKCDYKPGIMMEGENRNPIDWTTGDAKKADAIVVVLGITPLKEGEEGESIASAHKGDRPDLNLPENQVNYLKKLRHNNNKPIIVVLTGGSPITMPEVTELADAILFAWYPGQEGGNALGDILFGDVNPSGRLPITFPKSVDQLPPYEDYSMKERTYRYMTQDPLYPFGYGLSYTTFAYKDARLESASVKRGQSLRMEIRVENTGNRPGEEVVQFYLSKPGAGSSGPFSSLIGIRRVKLEPGQSQLLEFEISPDAMTSIDDKGKKQVLKGDYTLIVSGAAPVKRSAELGVDNRIDLKFRLK